MYSAAMVLLLVFYAMGTYWFVRDTLFEDLDDQLSADAEYVTDTIGWAEDGTRLVGQVGRDTADVLGGRWVQLWSLDGKLLYQTPMAEQARIALPNPSRGAHVSLRIASGDRWRVLDRRAGIGARTVFVRVGREEESLWSEIVRIQFILISGLVLGVVVAAAAGFGLARRTLAPVDRMAERANAITAERLSERLPVERQDELGRLAGAFNTALGRLDQSFHQMRQFTSDVSHELRTPLTAIRSVGEVGLQVPRSPEAYREIIGSMLEEVDRLSELVNTLLVLSRADAGETKLARQPIDLATVVDDTIAQVHVLAEDKNQRMTADLQRPIVASIDPVVFRQAVLNVLDNAIKYSPPGAPIHVALAQQNGHAALTVRDSGPGIPTADQARIFDRFYRADQGRAREIGGAGLGLAIARSVVEAHGGHITVESVEGQGATFRIAVPVGVG
jgi:heavy metal sensor kinase